MSSVVAPRPTSWDAGGSRERAHAPLASVVVPVYNTPADFLRRCVASVLAQTISSLELVIVDDGSDEATAVLCDEFASDDERCRALHQANGGVSSARNLGLESARGEYVMFVDSDDTIPGDALVGMVGFAERQGLDMVCGALRRRGRDCLFDDARPGAESVLSGDGCKCFASYAYSHQKRDGVPNGAFRGMGAKLFRRSVVACERFDTRLSIMEDVVFVADVAMRCRAIGFMNSVVYNYHIYDSSVVHSVGDGPWIEEHDLAMREHGGSIGLDDSDVDSLLCTIYLSVAGNASMPWREAVSYLARLRGKPCFERAFRGMTCSPKTVGRLRYLRLQMARTRHLRILLLTVRLRALREALLAKRSRCGS